MDKGYVHIYTGNGKGKTTSAIGLMVRAVGAGKKIYFGQFMKEGDYSEIKILTERFPEIKIEQYGSKGFIIKRGPDNEEINQAKAGIQKALNALLSQKFDMVVLDEINVAQFLDMVTLEEVKELIIKKPENIELVFTGRYAHKDIIEMADLVSEIKEVKHYFNDGVPARDGIEM